MKHIALICCLSFCVGIKAQEVNLDSLYVKALERYLTYSDSVNLKHYSWFKPSDTIFIDETKWCTKIPSTLVGKTIIVLNRKNWRQFYHRKGDLLIYLQLYQPGQFSDTISFSIAEFCMGKKLNKYWFLCSDHIFYRLHAREKPLESIPIRNQMIMLNGPYTQEDPAFRGGTKSPQGWRVRVPL